jgi:prepilin-type N-terminal cleavage/methylation domain-containing protein
MKIRKFKGFTVVEFLLCLAIILSIASLAMRVFYAEELRAFDRQLFKSIGIGKLGQYLILFVLVSVVYYFRLRDDYRKAKSRNIPLISKPTKCIIIFLVGCLLWFIFHSV